MDSRICDLERRIVALERRSRRWKVLGPGCLVIVSIWTCYPGAVREGVVARGFTLVDASGRAQAELRMTEEGPGLYLLDAQGTARASLVHNREETALYLRDAADQIRIGVAQFAHGGGGVALHGEAARGAAVLYFKEQGSLTFYDVEGNVVTRIPSDR
jgi:hypothetical protein